MSSKEKRDYLCNLQAEIRESFCASEADAMKAINAFRVAELLDSVPEHFYHYSFTAVAEDVWEKYQASLARA